MTEPSRSNHLIIVMIFALICAFAATALVGLYALLAGDDDDETMQLLGSGCMAVGYLALATAAAYFIHRGRMIVLMWFSIICAAGAFLAFLTLMWRDHDYYHRTEEQLTAAFGTTCTAFCAAAVHGAYLTGLKTKSVLLRIAAYAVVALGSLAAVMVMTLIWGATLSVLRPGAGFFMMLSLVQLLIIPALLGTILVPIAVRAHRLRAAEKTESLHRRTVTMTCPNCGVEQELTTGPCWCKSCRFTMMIEIEEPRCECGYLLYQLQGDTCPECGRPVVAAVAVTAST